MLGRKKKSEKRMEKVSTPSIRKSRFGNLVDDMRPRTREMWASWNMIRRNPSVMLGIIMVVFIIFIAAAAPFLAPAAKPDDPTWIPRDFIIPPRGPGVEGHILGTGSMGIDIYYGIVWGAQTTLYTAFIIIVSSMIIGIMVGSIAGYYGGKIDEVMMRITDIFLSLPSLILAMAVSSILSKSLDSIIFALTLVWWPSYARLIRGQVMSMKENTYVEAAQAIGCKKSIILFRHIIPNSITPVIVNVTMDVGAVALVAAALSYIGFGVGTGYAEWGRMVSDGQDWFVLGKWWCVVFPGLFILLFTMGFSLIGDGLRDILDPRAKR